MSTWSWSTPSHNRLSRSYVPSAAWQRHGQDRHRALKKARYLSLKVTGEWLAHLVGFPEIRARWCPRVRTGPAGSVSSLGSCSQRG